MAKVLLNSGETFDPNSGTFELAGTLAGSETVLVNEGVVVSTDSTIDRIEFTRNSTDYTYADIGTGVEVRFEGVAIVKAMSGQNLVFADGSAPITSTFNTATGDTTYFVGGDEVIVGGSGLTPTLSTAPGETSTIAGDTATTASDLTVDQDHIVGSGANDIFTGYIFDNQNTLQNGDTLDGGAGTDTLNAEVGNSQNFAIQPRITDVENIFIQAQATDIRDEADNFNTLPDNSPLGDQGAPFNYNNASHDAFTQIDAGKIEGVRQLWSDDSRANLVIEDVSVNSHLTTIGMRDTDPGNVNYEVYFDPQNITGPGAGAEGATLTIRLADVLALEVTGNGLNELPYDGINLNIGGASVVLAIDFAQFNSVVDPYGELVVAMQAALNAQGYSNITVEEAPQETAVFSITVTDQGNTYLQGTTASSLYSPIILTNSGPESISMVGYTLAPGTVEPSGNLVRTAIQDEASTTPTLTQVDIILDNVARGDVSGSGDLVIGDMSESGIQQFNVQVDRSSHLDQLASTNNILEVINVENIGANGDLRINQIDDVRVFDASTMVGDVTLGAFLSENVTGKYLDLQDTATDPAADNSELPFLNVVDTEFSYDLGTGNDTLELAISSSNLAEAGTTNREDFVLEVNGNAGNDDITLSIVDVDIDGDLVLADGNAANWYLNSNLNANLTINGGDGDDTISVPGSGNVIINAGSGADTVYADNTGTMAAFVFNTNGDNVLNNLGSDVNNTDYRFFNGKVTVTFQGFNVTVNLPNTNGFVSDLQVNQAIKAAINGDAVLNQLLVANDGPANTLVVTSLIDGVLATTDLSVAITVPTTLTSSEVALLNSYYGTPAGTAADHIATFNANLATFDTNADYVTAFGDDDTVADIVGSDSFHISDNQIEGSTGNDVIVLGTGIDSNDTLVYNGYNNGLDTVVNFTIGMLGSDAGTGGSLAVPAVAEVFTATFGAATTAGTITFAAGVTNLVGGETAIAVATAAAAATYTGWTAVDNGDGTVTFTATPGVVTDVVSADFVVVGTDATATAAVPTTQGAAAIPAVPAVAAITNVDFIDFSDYLGAAFAQVDLGDVTFTTLTPTLANNNVTIVNNNAFIDGFTVADLATTTIALDQILMIESVTNDGSYTVYHAEHAVSTTASAVTLTVIGSIDFGLELAAAI